MTKAASYQIRPAGNAWLVFMVRVDGEPVPVIRQPAVFTHPSRDRAQVTCDALNNGLLERATKGLLGERQARERETGGSRR